MNEKHRMLYPPIEASDNDASSTHRKSATAAMGLPVEPPPTYEAAISSPIPARGKTNSPANAPVSSSPDIVMQQPLPHHGHSFSPALPVIVEQPGRQTQIYQHQPEPQNQMPMQQPHQHQHHQQHQQHQQQQQNQILQHTVTVPTLTTQTPCLGPDPCKVTCPACGVRKTTRMSYTPNSRTHLCALLLCLVGWCCCACCVPYCMNSCRTGNHYCAKCNTFLGSFNPQKKKNCCPSNHQ